MATLDRSVLLARKHRRVSALLAYGLAAAVGLALAYLARWEFDLSVLSDPEFPRALGLLLVLRLGTGHWFRLAMGRWRYVGTGDFVRLLQAMTTGSLLFWALSWGLPMLPSVPRSVILLEWVFTGYVTGGTWIGYRLLYEYRRKSQYAERSRVVVVGAGEAGQQLVHQMMRAGTGYRPVGFVDDDPFMWGTLVHGVEVIGGVDDLKAIVDAVSAEELIIAIPTATPAQLQRIAARCEELSVPLKILPGIEDVLRGDVDLGLVRDVRVEDLLGRDPISLELPALTGAIRGKTVLVTGAAGSIGSELCRQVARHEPARLVLFDQAETPLYFLDLEIRRLAPSVSVTCVVGDVTHGPTVSRAFLDTCPDRVFHAAAYKHVPLMEANPLEAVRTNVVGTWQVAREAGLAGVDSFTLISTDKAVRPVNVMGATKHLAEKVVLKLQELHPGTSFGAVRFGNVLGSNGSVIPLFRAQLERGEPLTVTHEEVTRFFMTIPEAVQLVLQASLVEGIRGRVAMLEMGKPVRILDLARNLLRLSGQPFRPGENVIITGLRPGEKLHEELAAPEESVEETGIERVRLVRRPEETLHDLGPVYRSVEVADEHAVLAWIEDAFPEVGTSFEKTSTAVEA